MLFTFQQLRLLASGLTTDLRRSQLHHETAECSTNRLAQTGTTQLIDTRSWSVRTLDRTTSSVTFSGFPEPPSPARAQEDRAHARSASPCGGGTGVSRA